MHQKWAEDVAMVSCSGNAMSLAMHTMLLAGAALQVQDHDD